TAAHVRGVGGRRRLHAATPPGRRQAGWPVPQLRPLFGWSPRHHRRPRQARPTPRLADRATLGVVRAVAVRIPPRPPARVDRHWVDRAELLPGPAGPADGSAPTAAGRPETAVLRRARPRPGRHERPRLIEEPHV